jgi:general stress protein 26
MTLLPSPLMANEKLSKLYDLIKDIEIAMFTTRRSDGRLVSRPMATQKEAAGADLWFVTAKSTDKLDEIRNDAHVNLAYYKDRTREWVSVSGKAKIVDDRAKIHELWAPDWRAWFGDEGGPNDGTADDPRIILIGVDVEIAMFLEVNKPQPVVLFEVVKGMITGKAPDVGEMQVVDQRPGL